MRMTKPTQKASRFQNNAKIIRISNGLHDNIADNLENGSKEEINIDERFILKDNLDYVDEILEIVSN